jgi:hypothetical protein
MTATGNPSRSEQRSPLAVPTCAHGSTSRDICSIVIVVKFNVAKGHERQVQFRAGLKRKISEQLNVTKFWEEKCVGNKRPDAIQRITLDFTPEISRQP